MLTAVLMLPSALFLANDTLNLAWSRGVYLMIKNTRMMPLNMPAIPPQKKEYLAARDPSGLA